MGVSHTQPVTLASSPDGNKVHVTKVVAGDDAIGQTYYVSTPSPLSATPSGTETTAVRHYCCGHWKYLPRRISDPTARGMRGLVAKNLAKNMLEGLDECSGPYRRRDGVRERERE